MRSAWALGRSSSHLGPRGRRQIDSMSGGIHGSFTPQDGHTVASRATSVVHSRRGRCQPLLRSFARKSKRVTSLTLDLRHIPDGL